jgi:hypothetical protein
MINLVSWEDLGIACVARFVAAQSSKTPEGVMARDLVVMDGGEFTSSSTLWQC